jgi:hypothetical protein
MNRRSILAAIGLSPVAALPAVAATETPEERIHRLTVELRQAMENSTGRACRADVSATGDWVLVVANPDLTIGVCANDGPLLADDVTGTDDFARWSAKWRPS